MSTCLSPVIRLTILLVSLSATTTYAAPISTEPAAATSQAAYPLKTCVVSGGKLGGMGKPVTHVYQHAGQPDRTVIFCCRACIRKFEKEPAKFLARLNAAELAAGTAAKAAKQKGSAQ